MAMANKTAAERGAAAAKANATRQWLKRQGIKPGTDEAKRAIRARNRQLAGKPPRAAVAAAPTVPAPAPASSSTGAGSGAPPAPPSGGGGAASIASQLAGMAQPIAADPSIDPDLQAQLKGSLRSKPTWTNDGKVFRCWRPEDPKKVIELKTEALPGPHTPKEPVPDVLGQPDLLFAIAFAIKKGEYSRIEGPTGTAKTTMYRWIAQQLNYNVIQFPVSRGTMAEHMIGE